jgi:hypothetical protein
MSKAIVAKVTSVQEIPGADKIHVAVVLGENCIVSKDVGVGYVGILFPADTQLSEEYCRENNLFRQALNNKDNTKTGFFEENRRVRVQPFLKVKSQAYFTSLESLSYVGNYNEVSDIGYSFDTVNGKQICQKYISKATREALERQPKKKKRLIDLPYFEKHVDSAQFKHNAAMIPVGAMLSFTAKIHGTSHRSGLTKVVHTLPKWKQIVNKVYPFFKQEEWKHIVGTRNVILTEGKEGFHGSEQFRFDVMEMLKPFMTEGMTIYGEIAGYANGKPIMATHSGKSTKDKAFQKKYGENIVYKYNCAEHENYFFVYRITQLTQDGKNIDMSPAQIQQWCEERGLNAPLHVAESEIYDGDLDKLLAKVEALTERPDVLGADYLDPSHPGEGIIVRVDTGKQNPYFLKSKAYFFRCMEGLAEAADMEDLEAISE